MTNTLEIEKIIREIDEREFKFIIPIGLLILTCAYQKFYYN